MGRRLVISLTLEKQLKLDDNKVITLVSTPSNYRKHNFTYIKKLELAPDEWLCILQASDELKQEMNDVNGKDKEKNPSKHVIVQKGTTELVAQVRHWTSTSGEPLVFLDFQRFIKGIRTTEYFNCNLDTFNLIVLYLTQLSENRDLKDYGRYENEDKNRKAEDDILYLMNLIYGKFLLMQLNQKYKKDCTICSGKNSNKKNKKDFIPLATNHICSSKVEANFEKDAPNIKIEKLDVLAVFFLSIHLSQKLFTNIFSHNTRMDRYVNHFSKVRNNLQRVKDILFNTDESICKNIYFGIQHAVTESFKIIFDENSDGVSVPTLQSEKNVKENNPVLRKLLTNPKNPGEYIFDNDDVIKTTTLTAKKRKTEEIEDLIIDSDEEA